MHRIEGLSEETKKLEKEVLDTICFYSLPVTPCYSLCGDGDGELEDLEFD